jgi:hypothetical protein
MTIEVSASEFARTNKALLTLLKAVAAADDRKLGISTRALYAQIRMTGYGDALVDRAEREGYISRKKMQIDDKGPWYVFNILTKKGAKLLAQLATAATAVTDTTTTDKL